MKKLLPLFFAFFAFGKFSIAQSYTPIATFSTGGWNIDAVAENTTALLTTSGPIDGSNYVLYSAFYGSLWTPVGTGLPNSGLISSGTRTFQMQPYTQNNLVYLLSGGQETLTLVNPASYAGLTFLAFGTEGAPSMSITITFTDNTTQAFANQTVADWFSGGTTVIQGFDRLNRGGTTPAYAGATNPQMYYYNYNLTCANRAKQVKNIIITNSGTTGRICLAAVSGASAPSISANITPISCAGSTSSATIVVTGGLPAFTYTWGTTPVQTAATATGLAVGSYTYSVNDATGCTYTSTAVMPPNTGAQPAPTVLPFQNPVCSGQSLTFNATGAATYTWAGATNVTNGVAFTPTTSGVSFVSDYTVTGSNSCGTSTNSTIITLTVNPTPTVGATASSPSLCSGSTTSLTGSGASSYAWTGGVTNGASFSPTATSVYTVTGTNTLGCSSNAVITVTVVQTPTLAPVALPSAICFGKSSTVTATASNYTWLPSGANTSSVVLSPTTTTSYTVIKANANCVDTKTFTIIVNPLPTVAVTSSTPGVCVGATATLTAVSVAGNTFSWQPINTTGSVVIVNPSTATIYTTIVNNGTCQGTSTLALSSIPAPTITSTSTGSQVCAQTSVTLTANGGLSYTWSPGGANTSSIVITATAATLYSVTGVNAQGCFANSSQVIVVLPSPTVNIGVSDFIICNGNSSTLTASGANTYLWDNASTNQILSVSPTTGTSYTVTGYNSFSCAASATAAVAVFSPSVGITGNTVICSGNSATLTGTSCDSYTWTGATVPGAVFITSPTANTIYTVNAVTTSSGITCPSTNTVQVTVNASPVLTVTADRLNICRNETVNISASGANTYSWSTSATTPSISLTPTTVTNLILTVVGTSTASCESTGTIQIKVNSCNGLTEVSGGSAFEVFPNPNDGKFTLRANHSLNLTVVNSLGQVIQTVSLTEANAFETELTGLSSGVYFIRTDFDNSILTKKIIIRN